MEKGLSAKVNEITFEAKELDSSMNVVQEGEGQFHVLDQSNAFKATVLQQNGKQFSIKVNGTTFEVQLKDHYDRLVDEMGLSALTNAKANDIKAPMPGLVLDIMANVGDTVAKGDPVLILEAMKMENVLKSPGDGIIDSIEVHKGTAVEKGQLLIKIS